MSFQSRENYTVFSVENIFMKVKFNPSAKLGRPRNCTVVTRFVCETEIKTRFHFSHQHFAQACLFSFKLILQSLGFSSICVLSCGDTWPNLRGSSKLLLLLTSQG